MRWLLLLGGFFSQTLRAQSEPLAKASMEPLSSPYLLQLTGGLLIVVVVILALAWLARKFNLNQHSQGGLIKIIAGLPLGTRDRIVLLQVGEEQILVGLTPGRIEKLHTLAVPLEAPGEPIESASFSARLNRIMNERKTS